MNPLSHSVHLAEYYRPDAEGSISVINQTSPRPLVLMPWYLVLAHTVPGRRDMVMIKTKPVQVQTEGRSTGDCKTV